MYQKTNSPLLKKYARDPRQTKAILNEYLDNDRAFIFVLVDLEMPEMDGIEVLKVIR
jgi:CheY-like chemotaxis protein